jgi:cytochrome b6-f complex iron-sulfur subunit
MNENKKLSRQGFIKLCTTALFTLAGLLGLGGLMRFFSYQPDPGQPSEFELGDVDSYPIGSCTILPNIPAVIYNRNGEFIAYSLTCTHLGCTVEHDDQGFSCPCHGSRFDKDGNVLAGPAQKALQKLQVNVLEDNTLKLFLDGGRN